MTLRLTKDTLIAFLIVVSLAGSAMGLADETEAMLNPAEMAKLGIHRMPNGEWMQEAQPAAAGEAAPAATEEAAPPGVDHSGHIAPPDGPGWGAEVDEAAVKRHPPRS